MNRRRLLLGAVALAACRAGRPCGAGGALAALVEVGLVVGDRGCVAVPPGPVPAQPARRARAAEAAAARPASSTTSTTTTVTLSRPPPSLARRTSSSRGVGRVGQAAQHRRRCRLGHLVEQAVGAQHVAVAVVRDDRQHVDRHVVVDAEHPGEDVALRVDRRLLGRQAALAHQVGDQAVVGGELLELAAARGGRPGSRRRWRWPGSARPARRRPAAMATIVVPMPARSGSPLPASVDGGVGGLDGVDQPVDRVAGRSDSVERLARDREAISPPRWPPMPSATTQRPTSSLAR